VKRPGARISRTSSANAALEPKSGDILDTLGEVLFRKGQVARAIEVERRAQALDPKNPYLKAQVERFERGR
jgi:Flp pilus assembly protein TadD